MNRSLHVPLKKRATIYKTFRLCATKIENFNETNVITYTSYPSSKNLVKNIAIGN